jgi:DNA sulfur modification protein DndE
MYAPRRAFAAVLSVLLASSSLAGCAQLQQLGKLRDIQSGMHALAIEAAIYGVPIVAMYNLRNATSTGPNAKVRPNEILRVEHITNPAISKQLGFVTPNVNVLYGFGFMDLKAQPIILRAPNSHGRYYVVEIVDMWSNAFAYVGGATTGYAGGTFALVGPGWHGTLPPGVKRIDCPTRWIDLQPRVHVKNQADLPGAKRVLQAITVTGLAQYTGQPPSKVPTYTYAIPKIDPNVASSHVQFDDPLQFWEIFSAALNENPPPRAEIASVLPQFKYLGIVLGKPWKRESVNPVILAQMRAAAQEIGPMMQSMSLVVRSSHGWTIPPANVGLSGADYLTRAIVAVLGLLANTPNETIYYSAFRDGGGATLNGAKHYTITFAPPMTYIKTIPPGYWSLTMYDISGFTAANSIGRYSLGSDDALKRNADGSFTIYVQHDDPGGDKESNWLPAPSGPFYVILRNAPPAPAVVRALANPATFAGPPPLVPN